jgi:FtsX-like permease family
MTRLAWTFLRSAGWPRAALLAGTTALATALVLVALTMLLLPSQPAEALFALVAMPGLRVGTAFATALLVVPLLLMLNQVVRLGTATRERRLAGLRLAGATPAEVRRIGAVEVGFPVTAGAISGPMVFALLRELFGGQRLAGPSGGYYIDMGSAPALIPTSVTLAWWQIGAVVAVVAAAGIATGALASRHLVASPLGVSRRAQPPPPRAWGLLLLSAGLAAIAAAKLGVLGVIGVFGALRYPVMMAGILLVVLGTIALAPWVAFHSGQRATRRTSDPATLIAAAHLVSDPGPAGRAAAAVGAIGIVSGASAVLELNVAFLGPSGPFVDPFLAISFALVGVAITLVLLVTATTLAVHAAESILDRRRVLAALAATGTPVAVLRDSLLREAMLTSMPLSVGGVLLGVVVTGGLPAISGRPVTFLEGWTLVVPVLIVCAQVIVTVGLTWVAIRIAIRAVRHRLVLATSPDNLRTE